MANIKELNTSVDAEREAALDNLFSKMPAELTIRTDLPSKGKFYTSYTGVTVHPLTYEDEQRILVSRNNNIDPINALIEKCVEGVTINDIIPHDKLWLLLKIRETSYGPEYKFDIVCPGCSKHVESTVDISNVMLNEFPEDFTDIREIKLPMLKAKVKVRLPRVADEKYMDPNNPVANLRRYVVSIQNNEDPVFIAKALSRMHIRDQKFLRSNIFLDKYGVETKFQFDCPHCKFNTIMEIPFTLTFFLMS